MKYKLPINFNISLELFNTNDNSVTEVEISTYKLYGHFERYRMKRKMDQFLSSGGLWFDHTKRGGGLVLVDADCTYSLPGDVAYLLQQNGVIVPEEFY